ncbi:MAG: DUF3160 domain-containing protein [Oscillospiraceae bacterium]|jgi:tetratricopeptide (TPR) repeat protein|nr:DUF3160 domain-containing protein [Oscillospiraceae bacterium]
MKRIGFVTMAVLLVLTLLSACAKSAKPLTTPELLALGEKYLLEPDYEQALVQFLKVIEIEPMNPRGYTGAAEAHIGVGQREKSLEILRQGLEQLPDNPDIAEMLAVIDIREPISVATVAYTVPFADYDDYVYSGIPSIPDYTINAGLSNVNNFLQFSPGNRDWETSFGYWHSENELSDEAVKLIEQNGFAVSDKYSYNEFFQIYEANRYNSVPNFITTDSAVHTFHLMFDYVLKDLEQNKLYDILIQLSNGMVDASYAQYKELEGTTFETAALRNTAFFSLGSKLLDSGFAVPTEVADVVAQELALINAQEGISESPIINMGGGINGTNAYQTDYTQYITRSHYNQTEQLQAYFKAMMWYGQITFRSSNKDEVKSALLQTSALTDSELSSLWADIFDPTNFFVGECDDITYYQYADALKDVYGSNLGSAKQIADPALFGKALAIIENMPPPQINSVPIYETQDRDTAVTGYRFMGQRFTLDAYIFQNLIDSTVADRMLPNSLDIPAVFGSETALALLSDDISQYPNYTKQMTKLRTQISGIPTSVWSTNLYWSWMYMLLPYTDATDGAGYPMFMQNSAWTQKELNSFQGSWTELKHDTLLYAKAPMAQMGGGGEYEPPERADDRGYVEPNPVVFGRLAALVKQAKTGLQNRGILTAEADEALGVLYDLSTRLTEIAEKELANTPLSDSDYDFIRTYGGELEHIWDTAKYYELSQTVDEWSGEKYGESMIEKYGEYMINTLAGYYLHQHPCGVVADVATDPNGLALEEATGFAKTIFVVFPRDGELVLGSGTVFSQYEFAVPMTERITDEEWHKRMNENDLPDLSVWKLSFICDIDKTRYDAVWPN